MSDLVDGEVSEFSSAPASSERLQALLFLIDRKLDQRRRLQFQIQFILSGLILVSLVMLVWSLVALGGRWVAFDDTEEFHGAMGRGWFWALGLIFILAPFGLAVLHYLWISFAQIYYRSFGIVDTLLETDDFSEFRPLIHSGILEDDGSFLSQMKNMFTVDTGLAGAVFKLTSVACGALPLAAQALVSVTAIRVLWGQSFLLALGVGVFYFLFFALAALKSWALYRLIRSMG